MIEQPQNRLAAFRHDYLVRWWPAPLFTLLAGALFTAAVISAPPAVGMALLAILAAALFAHAIAIIVSLWRRRWLSAVIHTSTLFLSLAALFAALGLMVAPMIFGPSEDHFADALAIPEGLAVDEPLPEIRSAFGDTDDCFQAALLDALKTPGSTVPTISAQLEPLVRLEAAAPETLHFLLAASPAWRVFEEHGTRFATRRWKIGSDWSYTLHGYYTRHSLDMWNSSGLGDFQTRLTIGLDGKPWGRRKDSTTCLASGETVKLTLTEGNSQPSSHAVITAGDYVVDIMEQSAAPERRLTQAALDYLRDECAAILPDPSIVHARALLPRDAIRRGAPSLALRKSFQPGLYDAEIRVNPGERGMIYLKAFEVTTGRHLSAGELKTYSNEWIGWSGDPNEQFFSNTHFTIYEGDWGKPYAARFEVWFVPDAGGPERKIIERFYKIEGWQR